MSEDNTTTTRIYRGDAEWLKVQVRRVSFERGETITAAQLIHEMIVWAQREQRQAAERSGADDS